MNLDFHFPTPIWWDDTNIKLETIRELYQRLRDEDPNGRQLSNNGGWQSTDFKDDDHKELETLMNYILSVSEQCLGDYGYASGYKLKMDNLWFNANGKGHSNQIHTHSGSFLSGTFYVTVPNNASDISFYKNSNENYIIASAAHTKTHTVISGATCRYSPREGRMLLFPSYLPHEVLPSQIEQERVSLSFNLEIVYAPLMDEAI
jgi:uncharacterized protein (TIGR02466 family)